MGLGIVLVIVLIWLAFNQQDFNFTGNRSNTRNDALDILDEKYAKGEISEEEYMRKKRILRNRM